MGYARQQLTIGMTGRAEKGDSDASVSQVLITKVDDITDLTSQMTTVVTQCITSNLHP